MARTEDERDGAAPATRKWRRDSLDATGEQGKRDDGHPVSGGAYGKGKVTDFLANERTFLAWIRTGVTLIALGFVVARFGLLLRELATHAGATPKISTNYFSSLFGAGIVILAATVIAISYMRYVRVGRALAHGEFQDSRWLAALVTVVVGVIAVLLAIYLLLT